MKTKGTSGAPRARRVLVVYARAGQGHLAAAGVLREILAADPAVEVVLKDGEELEPGASKDDNPFVSLWNLLIRHGWFRLADFLFNHLLRLAVFPFLLLAAGRGVCERVKGMRPDSIVSTADIYSRPLGDAARDLGVPFTVMPVEFSIFADILHPEAEYLCYFEETCRVIRRFDLGTPHFQTRLDDLSSMRAQLGYLATWFATYGLFRVEPLLFQPAGGTGPEKNDLCCHRIGPLRRSVDHGPAPDRPPPGKPVILIASGSLGGQYVTGVVDALLRPSELSARVTALCGRDQVTAAALRARPQIVGRIDLEVLDFVDDLPRRLRCASILVARPSATTVLEAVLAGLPVLVPAQATRNDLGTIDLVRRWGIGEVYRRDRDMAPLLREMLPRLGHYRQRLREFRSRCLEPREVTAERIRSVVWRVAPAADGRDHLHGAIVSGPNASRGAQSDC